MSQKEIEFNRQLLRMMIVKCDCTKTSPRDVILTPGIDDRFFIGKCGKCNKKFSVSREHRGRG